MNQINIAGHLGADPEVRFTSSGQKVTTLRVATRVRRGAKDKDETIWWRVTVWGEQFDKMVPYLKKGSPVIACGELNKPEIFTDREGRSQISMSITAFNLQFSPFGRPDQLSHNEGGDTASLHSEPAYASVADQMISGQGKSDPALSHSDDEIPF